MRQLSNIPGPLCYFVRVHGYEEVNALVPNQNREDRQWQRGEPETAGN